MKSLRILFLITAISVMFIMIAQLSNKDGAVKLRHKNTNPSVVFQEL